MVTRKDQSGHKTETTAPVQTTEMLQSKCHLLSDSLNRVFNVTSGVPQPYRDRIPLKASFYMGFLRTRESVFSPGSYI